MLTFLIEKVYLESLFKEQFPILFYLREQFCLSSFLFLLNLIMGAYLYLTYIIKLWILFLINLLVYINSYEYILKNFCQKNYIHIAYTSSTYICIHQNI